MSEENHGGKFEYEYDALSNLSSTTFPDGRELATLRYGTGHLLEMQLRHGGTTHTLAAYGRDRLHREISRSQGVLSQETRYDSAGRVTQRTVLDARRELVFERRYRWDRTDQIVQQIHTDSTPATPGEKYSQYLWGYDAAGQVTKAVEPQKEERFFWDPAGNRTEEHRNPVWHNLLLRLDGLKLEYDGFGRLTRRQDKSGVIQHFAYDDEQRVKEIRFEGNTEFRRVEYRYDPLGRRTHKVLWRYNDPQPETIRFDWQGLQLAGEQSDREPDHYVQYVYTESSYEPLARIDSVFDDCEIYWYHTELNGLPERVTDADGQTVWRGQFSTWGETERELSVPQWQVPQNLRFQGQYLDRESGLPYNLFRYYDPVAGRYTQMDPIGLAGGINTYSYVGDPLVWVDPCGLAGCSAYLKNWGRGKKGFEKFWNNSTHDEFMEAWANPRYRENIMDRLRKAGGTKGGGYHEWLPVSQADKFKRMNVTFDEYMRWRTPTGKVKFLDDDGVMGTHTHPHSGGVTSQSSLAHKEMIAFAEKAKDIESYLNALRRWSSKRLPFSPFDLPF
nr:RHS repeat-associated core domain-containing protein [Cronobacter malonaticus]MDI7684255.1 RHS repeat-associated core domain-containing protein [Cronobacter malonaticus]